MIYGRNHLLLRWKIVFDDQWGWMMIWWWFRMMKWWWWRFDSSSDDDWHLELEFYHTLKTFFTFTDWWINRLLRYYFCIVDITYDAINLCVPYFYPEASSDTKNTEYSSCLYAVHKQKTHTAVLHTTTRRHLDRGNGLSNSSCSYYHYYIFELASISRKWWANHNDDDDDGSGDNGNLCRLLQIVMMN